MARVYQPLATKYRPQTFADVVGQDVAGTTLQNAIRAGRISHAYLFTGMRGVGKTTTARLLAKCLNCHAAEGPTITPCGVCESCTEIAAGRSIDVLEIDAASNTSVDDIRALQENLIYAPARDRYKVYIVDEVHMLSKSAFNAFLKTLEEPPDHVVFIFATTEMQKIPPTVLSRCLIFEFGRVAARSIADRLRWICAQEGIAAADDAIDLIVFQSEGSIRDAISALDQVINFAGGDFQYEHALRALGLIDRDVLHRLMEAIIAQNALESFAVIRRVAESGAEMRLFCRHLIRHVRDLLMARIVGRNHDLLPYSDDETELLLEQSQKLSEEDLTRFFDILVRADEEMQLAATPQYHLETAAVKMIHATRLKPLVELIERLQSGEIAQPSVQPRPAPPREQSLAFAQAPPPPAERAAPKTPRERLLAAAEGSAINSLLRMAGNITLAGDELEISVSSASVVKTFNEEPRRSELRRIAVAAFGPAVKVSVHNGGAAIEVDDEPPAPEPPARPAAAAATAPRPAAPPVADTHAVQEKLSKDPALGRLFEELNLQVDNVSEFKDEENES